MKNKLSKILLITFVILAFIAKNSYSYTGEIIKSFKSPGNFPTGMTFDGKNIWIADRKEAKLFCINPTNGEVIRSIEAPAYWPMGLAWDGEALWSVDVKGGIPLSENYSGKIFRVDPKDGTLLKTIIAPSSTPRGLTWDGKYLWCVDNHSDEIIQFSPDDGTTIRSFKAPAGDPRGLTFDGTNLWVSDRITNEIYMIDPETGTVLIVADAPGEYTRGLCFDGTNLWAADYQSDKIFELKIRDGEKFRRTNAHKSFVNYNHRITNFGPGTVKSIDVHIAIPKDRDTQEIHGKCKFITKPTDFIEDHWDQKTAHFHFENIKAGEKRNAEMKTEVTTYEVRYFIYPENVGTIKDIPKKITDKYLEDNEKYDYKNPIIQSAVKAALKGEKNPYWMARKLYNYLIQNMYYEMQGGWNTAPTVLERGNGSCSEYSFVYIAMCRAAGLPARYVGSVVIRGDYASLDDVFHRWVEVYLPGYGWIPIDPSGGDSKSPRHQANYFGHLANRFLITTESGGGSETMGWTYNSNESYITDPKTNVVTDHFAEWDPVEK